MKKTFLALMVLILSTPAWATVTISLSQDKTDVNKVWVHYNNTDSNLIRAFALKIKVDKGVIKSISNYKTDGVSTAASKGYGIYMGNIAITGDGNVTSYGNPVAPASAPDGPNQLGSNNIVIEMGSLYQSDGNKPANDANLCAVWVSADCNVCVTENATRGGVVMENAMPPTSLSLPCNVKITLDCFPSAKASYADWVTLGKPACWCAPTFQCFGDADGKTETLSKYRVYGNDISVISSNWKKKAGDLTLNACADVDHTKETLSNYRVYGNDVTRVSNYWKKTDTQLNAIGKCPDYFTR